MGLRILYEIVIHFHFDGKTAFCRVYLLPSKFKQLYGKIFLYLHETRKTLKIIKKKCQIRLLAILP